ncbi:TonB-dependent siderophore receptor [Sphingobium sp. PAMC28499]|uniref:TonB-dependent receptor n=1 Tax=Sphingobium sp. PAMC28499 TaxID=2565554 RepID=UPI00109DF627|nr:TonB-dependent siderophore receptor [Sphingobium sp. PAMC28499]QCB36694.1 TonB-dependent siderophore receptor [Sphingobium sp. PAMC28499]
MSTSRTRHPSAAAPAYLALSCVGLFATPAVAQDNSNEPNQPRLGGVTVTDTAIDEQGYKVDKAASPKYTAPLLDTPKTVIVLPSQVIRESGSTTFVEALRTVPGITFGAGEGGNPQGDRPFIRGSDAQGSTYIDGIRSVGGQSREIFAIEQIEVVKGGDSTMGGRGSAGGSLNLVSKMPHLGTDALLDLSYGTDDYKRATLDTNYQLGETAAVRLNAMWHDADVAKRDVVTYHRWGVSPSVAFGLDTSTRAFINYYHLESDDIPDPGIPFERAGNATQVNTADQLQIGPAEVVNGRKVDRSNFYGLADRDFRTTNIDELLFRFEHDLSDSIHLRSTAKYANNKQAYIITQPDDSQGNVANGLVWRRANSRWSDVDSLVGQIDLSGTFNTGSIEHSFSAGYEASWEQSKRGNFAVNTNVVNGAPAAQRCSAANIAAYNCTSLFDPNPYDAWANIPAGGTSGVPITKSGVSGITEATTYALYAFDTISFTDSLLLSLGLRHDWYKTSSQTIPATAAAPRLELKDNFFNYQAGLTYKPASNGSVYVSYAKSTTPPGSLLGEGQDGNTIALTTINDLKAEKTDSYEVGTKWELFDAAMGINLALFRTETSNARTTGANGLPEYVGERRIDGFEIGFNGKPLPFWSIFGGYTYMDSEIKNAGAGSVNDGKPFPNTPKHSFTAWTTFDIADRFQIGGGAIYNSKQYGSFGTVVLDDGTTGTIVRSIPGYWRFDATGSVTITDNVSVRVNIQNLANKRYYDRTYTTHFVNIAPGRSAFATLSLKY